ncbi:transposase [Thiomonas arsenitoxydans]|jgi:transposase|uniref:Transposase of ISThsp12, IS1634 family n=1 Tax=Thiomonas arsenitoxydans (strain DSM 22701 / CIP 110005 / 3As) TaxID=426114 RepID=D6CSZ0_THIA3|nr:IS1634-like element ISThsp12 family transposase [Thiomonas arsenitoxydans]CAZ88409.1 transposase of ISThsp12, IS1634 family [Thiomonas arsenitoxydans]CQR33519.1 transposase [Thiomonas arsenitoxydans]CQR33791.1 transposase [Thiomonas arsenitoxydans]
MFLKLTKSGGRHYAQLVASFRNEAGQPRQRTICTLGRLEPGGDVDKLIASLQRARGLDAAPAGNPLDGLRFEGSRCAGDVWALWQLWRTLGFDGLATAWRGSRVEVDVLGCLRAMVFNRLCDTGSKLGVLRWLETVALPLDFGFADGPPQHQHLLRAMDVIDEHSDALGARLATLMRPLIDEDLSVVFYDLTTVEVAGEAVVADDVRAYGMSKSGMVARQFMLSLVQTAEGLPIAHEVHPGNIAEAKTLLPMIKSLLARYPLKRVVLVADRGLLSVNNLDELATLQATLAGEGRAVSLEYVLAVPTARYGDFAEALRTSASSQPADQPWVAESTWQSSSKSSSKSTSPSAPIQRRLVIAHDPEVARRRTQARNKAITELLALGEQWGGKLDAQDAGASRRGRPLSDSGAKARFYHAAQDASLAHLIKVDLQAEAFSFHVDEDKQRDLELLDGKLLLVTNTDAPAVEVVQRYKSLADIERGFRVLKSDIEIGPVYHRLPKRIRAHALVCFMALILYRVMRMRLKANDHDESPIRLLQQLQRIHQQTVRTADGQALHGLTEMTPTQKSLFSVLQLPMPTPAALSKPVL